MISAASAGHEILNYNAAPTARVADAMAFAAFLFMSWIGKEFLIWRAQALFI
jgi:hypothetical protein